jgi:hypothetical protein
MTYTKCIDDNLDNMHPWIARHQFEEQTFTKIFQNDIHKL